MASMTLNTCVKSGRGNREKPSNQPLRPSFMSSPTFQQSDVALAMGFQFRNTWIPL